MGMDQSSPKDILVKTLVELERVEQARETLQKLHVPTGEIEKHIDRLQKKVATATRVLHPEPLPHSVSNINDALRPPPGMIRNEDDFRKWERGVLSPRQGEVVASFAEAVNNATHVKPSDDLLRLVGNLPPIPQEAFAPVAASVSIPSAVAVVREPIRRTGSAPQSTNFERQCDDLSRRTLLVVGKMNPYRQEAFYQLIAAALVQVDGPTSTTQAAEAMTRVLLSFGTEIVDLEAALKQIKNMKNAEQFGLLKPESTKTNYFVHETLIEALNRVKNDVSIMDSLPLPIREILEKVEDIDRRELSEMLVSPFDPQVRRAVAYVRDVSSNWKGVEPMLIKIHKKSQETPGELRLTNRELLQESPDGAVKPSPYSRAKQLLHLCGILEHEEPGNNRSDVMLTGLGHKVLAAMSAELLRAAEGVQPSGTGVLPSGTPSSELKHPSQGDSLRQAQLEEDKAKSTLVEPEPERIPLREEIDPPLVIDSHNENVADPMTIEAAQPPAIHRDSVVVRDLFKELEELTGSSEEEVLTGIDAYSGPAYDFDHRALTLTGAIRNFGYRAGSVICLKEFFQSISREDFFRNVEKTARKLIVDAQTASEGAKTSPSTDVRETVKADLAELLRNTARDKSQADKMAEILVEGFVYQGTILRSGFVRTYKNIMYFVDRNPRLAPHERTEYERAFDQLLHVNAIHRGHGRNSLGGGRVYCIAEGKDNVIARACEKELIKLTSFNH